MGIDDKIDEGAGKVKETTGRLKGDEEMQQEGEAEKDQAQLKGKVQDAVGKGKDMLNK